MVEGPGAMKQVQPLWQDQQQWAFALDIAEGQANAHPSLQLPSLPGLEIGMPCSCTVTPCLHHFGWSLVHMCLVSTTAVADLSGFALARPRDCNQVLSEPLAHCSVDSASLLVNSSVSVCLMG